MNMLAVTRASTAGPGKRRFGHSSDSSDAIQRSSSEQSSISWRMASMTPEQASSAPVRSFPAALPKPSKARS